jgi:hypothetical protein
MDVYKKAYDDPTADQRLILLSADDTSNRYGREEREREGEGEWKEERESRGGWGKITTK